MNEEKKMGIGYDKLELILALHSISIDFNDDENVAKVEAICQEVEGSVPSEKSELNKKIAEYNGISVTDLVSSSNYQIFCREYKWHIYRLMVKKLEEIFGLSEKQAWAVICWSQGLLD